WITQKSPLGQTEEERRAQAAEPVPYAATEIDRRCIRRVARRTRDLANRAPKPDGLRTLLVGETPAVLRIEEDPIGRVQAYTFGYERDLPIRPEYLNIGLGFQGNDVRPAVPVEVGVWRPSCRFTV